MERLTFTMTTASREYRYRVFILIKNRNYVKHYNIASIANREWKSTTGRLATARLLFGDYRLIYFHSLMKSAFPPSRGLLCLYDKQNKTWLLIDMEFLFSCSTRHLTRSLRSLVSYRVKHSKRNSIPTRTHISFFIYHTTLGQTSIFLTCRLLRS